MGVNLFTAHNLVLSRQAEKAAAQGAPPGINSGPLSQKSVDKVSASYDTAAGIETGAGHWNLTTYGTRFVQMANMMGAGPVQVGAGCGIVDPLSSINAWPGPYTGPGFSNFG